MSTLTQRRIFAGLLIALSAWIVHGFLPAMLAACVIAIATWPLYRRFSLLLSRRLGKPATATLFTSVITAFVLAPIVFSVFALLGQVHSMLAGIAEADGQGLAVPPWLAHVPVIGTWLAARWQSELAHPGALSTWTQRADPAALIGVAQSLGQFTARHVLIVGFAILLLGFLYRQGASLGREATRTLRASLGDRADRYVDVAVRAVRSAVSSMLLVGLFDGMATALAYTVAGAPRSFEWAAITGALAAIPFLGYVAVIAMTAQHAVQCSPAVTLSCLVLGCLVLLCGDKVVRPLVARGGMRLPFVWVLIGCIGGFEALGLAGLVVGPVALTLARELWDQHVRDRAKWRDPVRAVEAQASDDAGASRRGA